MTTRRSRFLSGIACGGLAALFAGRAEAQFYWPPAYAFTSGNAVLNAPFTAQPGHPTNTTRCMVVISQASLPFTPGTTLNQLSLRRDVGYPSTGYGSFSGALTVKIGSAALVPDDVQDVRFARLWNGIPTQVYKSTPQAPFVVPAGAAPGTSTPPWNVVIPFQKTFTYNGGPIAIEFLWTPTSGSTAWRLDGFAMPAPRPGSGRPAGPGCLGSNGFVPFHYALPETTMPGSVLTTQMEGSRLPPSPGALENLAFHVLGLQNTTYQGQPLPVPLSAVGGPPGCFLRVDPLLTFTVFVGNPSGLFGRAKSLVSLAPHPALVGAVLYSQWLLFDGAFNVPLPIISSDAQAITLGQILPPAVPHAARTLWKYGATGFDQDSGRMVLDDHGPVMRFN